MTVGRSRRNPRLCGPFWRPGALVGCAVTAGNGSQSAAHAAEGRDKGARETCGASSTRAVRSRSRFQRSVRESHQRHTPRAQVLGAADRLVRDSMPRWSGLGPCGSPLARARPDCRNEIRYDGRLAQASDPTASLTNPRPTPGRRRAGSTSACAPPHSAPRLLASIPPARTLVRATRRGLMDRAFLRSNIRAGRQRVSASTRPRVGGRGWNPGESGLFGLGRGRGWVLKGAASEWR